MNRLMHRASDYAREDIPRDAQARKQLELELSDIENLAENLEALPPHVQARFLPDRTPFPTRPSLPPVPNGSSAQFSKAPRPPGIDRLVDLGYLALAMVFVCPELVLRGGHWCELADSRTPSFKRALLRSFSGMFRGPWRSSIKWFGLVGRSAVAALLAGNIPAHVGGYQAFKVDDCPARNSQTSTT